TQHKNLLVDFGGRSALACFDVDDVYMVATKCTRRLHCNVNSEYEGLAEFGLVSGPSLSPRVAAEIGSSRGASDSCPERSGCGYGSSRRTRRWSDAQRSLPALQGQKCAPGDAGGRRFSRTLAGLSSHSCERLAPALSRDGKSVCAIWRNKTRGPSINV